MRTALLKRVRPSRMSTTVRDEMPIADALLTMRRPTHDLSTAEQRFARMLFFSLWPDGGGLESYDDGLEALRSEPAARDEIRAVMDIVLRGSAPPGHRAGGPLAGSPAQVHARYQREEILAGLD